MRAEVELMKSSEVSEAPGAPCTPSLGAEYAYGSRRSANSRRREHRVLPLGKLWGTWRRSHHMQSAFTGNLRRGRTKCARFGTFPPVQEARSCPHARADGSHFLGPRALASPRVRRRETRARARALRIACILHVRDVSVVRQAEAPSNAARGTRRTRCALVNAQNCCEKFSRVVGVRRRRARRVPLV